jgi:hypothetical protein
MNEDLRNCRYRETDDKREIYESILSGAGWWWLMMESCGGAINQLGGAARELENHGVIGQGWRNIQPSSRRVYP